MEPSYRLSRNFVTYPSDEVMSPLEINIKSSIALILGIVPFVFTKIFLFFFWGFTNAQCDLKENNFPVLSFIVAPVNFLFVTLMMFSATLFSWSQRLVWGKYVPQPSGDSINSRLAQYGSGCQPWIDLKSIFKAFFCPCYLEADEWTLEQWSNVSI